MYLDQALKEWAVTVDALLGGKTVMLIRKGGIRDGRGHFTVKAQRVLLFPTYEHQRSPLLKPAFADLPTSNNSAETIPLAGWAEITHAVMIQAPAAVQRLDPWHIWNQTFVDQRLQWQPQRPLAVLLLRSHRLSTPVQIPQRPEYGGCRSWISLAESVDITASQPVLATDAYEAQVEEILGVIAHDGLVQTVADVGD
ncbi:hypothetical protein C7271_09445 [filamentous cyanobacterium CCP5]|nr:hypothetical protein C7271_09445 [filamentous cyanobacterium CCP5]